MAPSGPPGAAGGDRRGEARDGWVELVRLLRIVQKDLPFVALSGSVTKERQAELEGLGIKSILNKPCEASGLLHAVHRALVK